MSDHQKNRKGITVRQVFAWIAILLLVGMYILTFVFSMMDSPLAQQMFHASLYCTFFIPVISWVFLMTVRLVKGSGEDNMENNHVMEDNAEDYNKKSEES